MKKIIVIMLVIAMLMCSCGTAENVKPTDATTESTVGTEDTTEVTEPSEEVIEPSSEVTEPSSEELTDPVTDPEPDPYAEIKYYPFPLLDMTVAEIEAAYGEYLIAGYDFGNEYLYFPLIDIHVLCPTDELVLPEDKAQLRDKSICGFYITKGAVYPGLEIGMTGQELPETVVWSSLAYTGADTSYSSVKLFATIDDYKYTAYFPAPFDLEETFHITDLPEGSFEEHRDDYLEWSNDFMKNPTTELGAILITKSN